MVEQTSLCRECNHRFRKVFMPTKSEELEDCNGEITVINDENVLIIQICLISGIDIDGDVTIECNYFESKEEIEEKEDINIFRCIK